MSKKLTALLFIVLSCSTVFFGSDFSFINNYLKASPQVIYAVSVIFFLICLKFNKSRVVFILFLLLMWFFKSELKFIGEIPEKEFIFIATLNVLLLATSKERGILSIHGFRKLILTGALFLIGYFVAVYHASYYTQSPNSVVKTVHYLINMHCNPLPFLVVALSVTINVVKDKNYEVSTAIGAATAFLILSTLNIELSFFNLIALFVFIFIGILASIYTTSYTDELTGLPSRRAYNEYAASLGAKYAIAMSDIDHFKKFNDTFGHDTGDEVLKLVAKVISSVGGGGRAFRFGGEEFVIVFNGKTKEEAFEYLENIREKLENTPFTVRNKKSRAKYKKTGKKSKTANSKTAKITVSIGASDSRAEKTVVKVMKKADQQLYKAKKTGRNKVVV
ncbi:MAG: GGDEF domain-containing protein [bacterium]